ncbi:MAG: MerR family transcriptional regulator [Flavisolibacter sp.]
MSFTIRELELLSGIKAHTIRIWEQRYNFLKPSRTLTNIRTYSNEELKTLLTVALLNKYGYKISRIDQMEAEQRNKAVLQLPDEDAGKEGIVNELIGCMIELKNVEFEEILNRELLQRGFEETITGLIFSFLEKVGILWQTNRIIPLQEHIVSNIIRQKIVCAIEGLIPSKKKNPLFLLFLPEDEHHEMGLLYVFYLLRKKSIPVLYLGANVPLNDLKYLFNIKSPEYIYLHLTSFSRRHNFQKYVNTLSQMAASSAILMSGAIIKQNKVLPENVTTLSSFEAVQLFIDTLE